MLIPARRNVLKSTGRHGTIRQEVKLTVSALWLKTDRKKGCSRNLKELQPEILYWEKLSFSNEGERKTFSNSGKLKWFVDSSLGTNSHLLEKSYPKEIVDPK